MTKKIFAVSARSAFAFVLAMATGTGIVASLVLGRLYDCLGLPVMVIAIAITSLFSPLVFLGGFRTTPVGLHTYTSGIVIRGAPAVTQYSLN